METHETVVSGDLGVPDEAGDNAYTVVLCPEGVEAAVDGLTISQGNANGSSSSEHLEMRGGGGVHNSGTMTVRNSDVSKNSAYFGGGVCNSRGNLTIVDCGFEENHATLYGGAIYNTYGTVAATDSTISGNSADSSGGALCSDRGIISLTDSTFSANAAERSVGGAIRSSHDTLTITGSTFEANSASSTGGAIHVEWGELTIADSLLRGNTAADGGAVYNYGTALDVTDTTISENTADDDGGGVYSTKENATFTGVTFERNTTDGAGGGIYGTEGEITVSDSSFSENEAEEAGGAIYRAGYELLSISNTDLTSNASAGSGGAVYSAGGIFTLVNSTLARNTACDGGAVYSRADSLTISRSVFEDNTADRDGGGIYLNESTWDRTSVELIDSRIRGNTAGRDGGGVCIYTSYYSWGSSTVFTNSTLVGNSAASRGGALFGDRAPLTLASSTLAGNAAGSEGGEIYHEGGLTLVNSIVALNPGDDLAGLGAIRDGSVGNLISVDPKFVRNPGTNGPGDYGDLHLSDTSAAIGAGVTDALPADDRDVDGDGDTAEPLPLDLDGNIRVFGEAVDVGAYEFQGTPADGRETPSTRVTTAEDTFDLYDGHVSLREAIHYAEKDAPGDPITFASELSGATILLDQSGLFVGKAITVDASALSEGLTVDGGGEHRVFTLFGGEDQPVEFVGLTVANGNAIAGGGLYNYASPLAITDCTFVGNTAGNGGALFQIGDGGLTVTDSRFSENSAEFRGGAVYAYGSTNIVGSVFSANSARDGGGIAAYNGTLAVANSTLTENTATEEGGALWCEEGSLTLVDSTLSANSADVGGGGIFVDDVEAAIANCSFTRNTAGENGGAIHKAGKTMTLTGSVLSENSADLRGGAVYGPLSGTLIIKNSTLAMNTAGEEVGGLYCSAGLEIVNSIIALNTAGDLQGELAAGTANNLIGVDPEFVRSPGTNGADDYGDFRLRAESLAIDAGDATKIPVDTYDIDADGDTAEPLPLDYGGNPRVFGAAPDIGAYEYQGAPAGGRETPSTIVTTATDTFDVHDGSISLREAVFYASAAWTTGPITFAPELSGATIVLDGRHIVIDHGITIDASSLAGGLTIDGNAESRIFAVTSNDEQPAVLVGLTITNGAARDGAGIYNLGRLNVTDCTFLDNTADSSGGAIRSFGTLVMANCVLSENTARDGGALRSSGSTTLTGSVFTRNQAGHSGGGVSAGGTLNVENCVFVGNFARAAGGAFWGLGDVTLTNSTLAANRADGRGGGIYTFSIETSVVLNNTIVAANTAPVAPDCSDEGNILSGSHSLIGDGTGQSGLVDGENGNLIGTEEVPVDPRFVRAPSDGGDGWGDDPDTADVDESLNDDYGDLHLSPYSSAVDAGDNALLPVDVFDLDGDGDIEEPIPVDLAGNTRIQDGDEDGTATVNMGAYESVAGGPPIPGDLNGDRLVDSGDLDLVRVYWGQTVSLGDFGSGDASGDGKVGAADLDIVRANWGTGAPAAASEGQLQMETRTRTNVYGPLRKAEVVPARERDAVFANAREIAEVLWAEALERSQSRENCRAAVAVDWVLSEWEGD